MANIGGTLGLFMGISFVTAFEFLEFIVDMIVLALYKAKQKGKTTPANGHAWQKIIQFRWMSLSDLHTVIVRHSHDLRLESCHNNYTDEV